MTIVGLVPAAGHATRLAGLVSGSKEIQPVRGRPVMTYLMDRMRAGGASRIVITTRPDKADVVHLATMHGAEVVLGEPPTLGASLRLAADSCAYDELALLGFPDSVWTPTDGFRTLVELASSEPIVLGCFESGAPSTGEAVVADDAGRLLDLERRATAPSSPWIWAVAAVRVAVLRELLVDDDLSAALLRRTADQPIATVRLGRIIDIGTPASLAAADDDAATGPHD